MTKIFPVKFDDIRVALVDQVQLATELTCILAEPESQNYPRPAKPYFTLKFTGPAGKSGDDSATNVPNNLGQPTTVWNRGGQRKVMVDFNCYATSHEQAYNYMTLWQAALEQETVQANLRLAGIAVWLNGSVTDLSALLNTGYEGRAHMEVKFGVAANLTEDLGAIEHITIVGEISPT
jgi:hypothetical protein